MTLKASVEESPLELVNVVGSGELGTELDLEQVTQDLDVYKANYRKENGAVFLKVEEDSGLVILYRSGKYIVRGGKESEKLYKTTEEFLRAIKKLDIIKSSHENDIEINNLVFVGDLGHTVNLKTLVVQLGLENAEFEPEQFPGLVYRPDEFECVLLIFGSGKVSLTGSNDINEAVGAFQHLEHEVDRIV